MERPPGRPRAVRARRSGDRPGGAAHHPALGSGHRPGRRRHLGVAGPAPDPPGAPAGRGAQLQSLQPGRRGPPGVGRGRGGAESRRWECRSSTRPTPSGDTVDLALFGVPADSFLVAAGRRPGRARRARPAWCSATSSATPGIEVGDTLTVVGPDQQVTVRRVHLRRVLRPRRRSRSPRSRPGSSSSTATTPRGRFSAIAVAPDGRQRRSTRRHGPHRRRRRHRARDQGAGLPGLARVRRGDHHDEPHPRVPPGDLRPDRGRLLHRVDGAADPPDRADEGPRRLQRLRAARRARPARRRAGGRHRARCRRGRRARQPGRFRRAVQPRAGRRWWGPLPCWCCSAWPAASSPSAGSRRSTRSSRWEQSR